jgi:hypothetical protein
MDNYQTNSSIHTINTRCKNQLYRPVANLSSFQKGVFYSGLRIFNNLPSIILECQNNKSHFRAALRKYLVAHCFYSLMNFYHILKKINYNSDYHSVL